MASDVCMDNYEGVHKSRTTRSPG